MAPLVFFAIPLNETDHPTEIPLALTFGVENFQLGAVPEGSEYKFSVQIGDDKHRTIAGLCETITIRMEDGI